MSDIKERLVRVEDGVIGLSKDIQEVKELIKASDIERKQALDAHGRRLGDLESWRNRILGAWAITTVYLGWRHK